MNNETQNLIGCDVYHYESLDDIEPEYLRSVNDIVNDRYLNDPAMQYLLALGENEEFLGVVAFKVQDNVATLCEIFVEDEFRGTGVAKQLMEDFEDASANKIKQLTVESENTRAIQFYRNCGYELLNEEPSANLHLEKQ